MEQQWALPAKLPSLSTREAIADAAYRCALSFDTGDMDLLESSFTQDAVFNLNGSVMSGITEIRAGCLDRVSRLDTTHFVNNIRISHEEGNLAATLTASALAQHYRAGEGIKPNAFRFLGGSFWWADLVMDETDGLWKAKKFRLKVVWAEGNRAVMSGS